MASVKKCWGLKLSKMLTQGVIGLSANEKEGYDETFVE